MIRVIARLDCKGSRVVKGVQMDGWYAVGDPNELARRYADQGADELLLMDVMASLTGRNGLVDEMERMTEGVFVPVTIGGGLRTVDDMRAALNAGADKVAINTAAINNPSLITRAAERFGRQAIVVSIEAKRRGESWEAFTDGGREATNKDAIAWAREAEEAGAGEILVTSVDRDGTGRGLDRDLALAVSNAVGIPVVVSGGLGDRCDLVCADGVCAASALHAGRTTIARIKEELAQAGAKVRLAA